MRVVVLTLLLSMTMVSGTPGQQPESVELISREIEAAVERLGSERAVRIGSTTLVHSGALVGVYERRGFAPIWNDSSSLRDLVQTVADVRLDGLDPAHYHGAALTSLSSMERGPEVTAMLDLLATDALIRIAHDLRFGKVVPRGPTTGPRDPSPFGGDDFVDDLIRVVEGGRVREAILDLRPSHFVYQGLVRAFAALDQLRISGGWGRLPAGPALRVGSMDTRVSPLRERLALSGDLAPPDLVTDDLRFDAQLENAVRSFQHRHGLNEDGVVGPRTLAELNVPVERRIDQIRINLERARWVTHEMPETFVAVNVAGALVYLVRNGMVVFEARAIVGKDYTKTPVFRALLRTIELNPTWTVPDGIVEEVLARVQREPDYLAKEGIRVLDRSGRQVDPSAIPFSEFTARTFPYHFRQDPGPANALGRIKFIFPNDYDVYLHDTPARSLFTKEERLFSHGCIRVDSPILLAELVLDDPELWSREAIEAAMAEETTRAIPLATPLLVFILYWTASTDMHGELHFYRDVYARDAELLAALIRP